MTATTAIDLETARRLLDEVSGEHPDRVYRSPALDSILCVYIPLNEAKQALEAGDMPSWAAWNVRDWESIINEVPPGDVRWITGCVIGEALTRHGEERHRFIMGSVITLKEHYPDLFTSQEAVDYLNTAQLAQDKGATWRTAYLAAEAWLRSSDNADNQ